MDSILKMQFVLTALITFSMTAGAWLSSICLGESFAKGHSNKMSYLLEEAKDPELFQFKFRIFLITGPSSFMINQTLILFETMCYIKIFEELKSNDQRLGTKALGEKAMMKRKKKNVLTLRGQFISFIVETGFGILISTFYFFPFFNIHLDESLSIFVLIISSNSLSFTYLCTSAELRRHYLNGFCSY